MKQGIFVWVGLLMLGSVTLSGDPLWAEERHARGLAPDAESTKALDMLEAFPRQAEWDIHWVRAMQGDEKAAARIFVWMRDLEETLVLAKEANVPPEELMTVQFMVGSVYRYGIGTPRDEKRAVFWYRKSAEHGYAPAQLALALLYWEDGEAHDGREALTWMRKAAEQGNAAAQTNLGIMYDMGDDVAQDAEKAVFWYRKAAEQGEASAQYLLGRKYRAGEGGLPQSEAEAALWYEKAAKQGLVDAQLQLGALFSMGMEVPQSDEKAAFWTWRAAEQGNADAQYSLGTMFTEGRGVPRNDTKAAFWMQEAAEQGDAFAQFDLAQMYEKGRGIPQSDEEAARWYEKAATQEYAPARLALEKLREKGIELPRDIVHKETVMPDSASSLAPSDEPAIGSATMEDNGDIVLDLRAVVEELGIVGDTQLRYKPGEPGYAEVLKHLGGLKPGESKLVPPWPDKKGR